MLRHAEAIQLGLAGAAAALSEEDGAASERLQHAKHLLEEIADWEPGAAGWARQLDELQIQLQEVVMAVARRLDEVELDPGRLDAVEGRLAVLERLFRRYGEGSNELIARRDRLAVEIGEQEGDEEGRERLERDLAAALVAYREAAGALSAARRQWGEALAARVGAELGELALARARFAVRLETRRRADSPLELDGTPVEFGPDGYDQVIFELAANPGEELRPLAKIASGGEMARIYLALQVAVRGEGGASGATMVFDEVDVGIGGREAAAVAAKLHRLARGGQILVVTHLPQVASRADRHFRIRKRVEGGRTFVAVEPLGEEARIEEVARMLAGERITDLSRSHARELIAGGGAG